MTISSRTQQTSRNKQKQHRSIGQQMSGSSSTQTMSVTATSRFISAAQSTRRFHGRLCATKPPFFEDSRRTSSTRTSCRSVKTLTLRQAQLNTMETSNWTTVNSVLPKSKSCWRAKSLAFLQTAINPSRSLAPPRYKRKN